MRQLEVIPLRIVELHPLSRRATAHAFGRARAEDGNYFIVKRNTPLEPGVCAAELACSSIADSLNLPVAQTKVLQSFDGELLVGSQVVDPMLPEIETARLILGNTPNDHFVPQINEILSATYALDLMIGNVDRHEDNFLISTSSAFQSGQRVGHIRLIDFASSDLLYAKKVPLPFSPHSNTVKVGRAIRAKRGFALASAQTLISRLRDNRRFLVERAMFGMPPQWLSNDDRETLDRWINSYEFDERLEQVENGLRDGNCL